MKRDNPTPSVKTALANNNSISKVATSSQSINSPKLEILKNDIEVVIPKKMDSVKVIYLKKAARLPKPAEPNKPRPSNPKRAVFHLNGNHKEFPELAAFEKVAFEVGQENTNYNEQIHDITWSDVKMDEGPSKGENYWMTLTHRNRVEKLVVYPVLEGKELDKAQNKYAEKYAEYQNLITKRNEAEKELMSQMEKKQAAYVLDLKKKQMEFEKERLRIISDMKTMQTNELASNFNVLSQSVRATRLFNISQFGIYNSDCPHPLPNGGSFNPIFVIGDSFVNPDCIYLVDHSRKTVYSFDKSRGFTLNYDPKSIYSVCVFQKNKLFICNKKTFAEAIESRTNKLNVTQLPESSENIVDFKKAIEI